MKHEEGVTGDLVSFDRWLESLGITRNTGWRWRKLGLISPINIFGRLYLPKSEIERFNRRAIAGEFSKEAKMPIRKESSADR